MNKTKLNQFGQTTSLLGIKMIPTYSPEVLCRHERVFRPHRNRLSRELTIHGINNIDAVNRSLAQVYQSVFNAEFMRPVAEKGSALMKWIGAALDDIVCEPCERNRDLRQLRQVREKNTANPCGLIQVPLLQVKVECIGIRTALRQFSMALVNLPIIMNKEN